MADNKDMVYVQMSQASGSARFGKLTKDRIVPIDGATAARWLGLGIAKESSESAYKKQQEKKVETGDNRAAAVQALNQPEAALWDVSYRDAVHAHPDRLKQAIEYDGVTLVNTDQLHDEDGGPLPMDASFEDIMEARDRMRHPDEEMDSHEQSSVFGGGSHYQTAAPDRNQTSTAKPTRRVGRRMNPDQVGNAKEPAETSKPRSGATSGEGSHQHTTTGDTLGNVSQS